MERIILIETSTALCSVALAENGTIVDYRESSAPKAHASLTAVFIQEMLAERGLTVNDCDAVCVSMGPGSYTGLRVGVSTAKGLCFGAKKPLVAVGTLDTLVAQADTSDYKYIIPMIDARRMEVYTQLFNAEGVAQSDVEAKIIDEESFSAERTSGKPFVIFGSGAAKCAEVLKGATLIDIVPSARGMARLAEQAFAEGKTEDVAYFEPFYLKDFVVGTAKKSLLERVTESKKHN